jgi:uncharacterized protein
MGPVLKQLVGLIDNSRLKKTSEYIQHGNTSCLLHTIAVAHYSIRLSERLRIRCKKSELIRGALLHDYFLYDWHDGLKERRIHGFTHPAAALKNADKDFNLTHTERDIIKKHMFPLTFVPPKYRESWIVCCVDKACSLYETFHKDAYPSLRFTLKSNHINF